MTCIHILVETFARQRWLFSFSMNGFVTLLKLLKSVTKFLIKLKFILQVLYFVT